MKKYAIIQFWGISEEIEIDILETSIEKWTTEFNDIIEGYEDNNNIIMVVDYDKFCKEAKKVLEGKKETEIVVEV